MEALSVRQFLFQSAAGPHNMAMDEVLLEAAAAGVASFRLYGWSAPTLSLGYFQPQASRSALPKLTALPYVRRPTGGLTLVHHHELTYALALPAEAQQSLKPDQWLVRLHTLLRDVLEQFGVFAQVAAFEDGSSDNPLCFHHITRGDVLLEEAKIVGSAQRRHHGALLQHGAILLAKSSFTPTLPGIAELTGRCLRIADIGRALAEELQQQWHWSLNPAEWTSADEEKAAAKIRDRYSQSDWNDRR